MPAVGGVCSEQKSGLYAYDDNNLENNTPLTPDQSRLQTLGKSEPPYCECARFAKRPLAIKVWLPIISNNPGSVLDKRNLELAHEHLAFDQSKDNIGFGPDGLFSEPMDKHRYRYDKTCYDGSAVRKALLKIQDLGNYHLIKNNCQDFSNKVREAIKSLF